MNTEAIKAYAISLYHKGLAEDSLEEDNWFSFDDNWDINFYLCEWEDTLVRCAVYPVIDGLIDSSSEVYSFSFPRETNND